MLVVVIKVSSIEDTTQKELREVESTGTHSAGEKSLADLRKRKLAVQKFGTFNSLFWFSRLTFM
jgi:phenylalanyl-tRNA synthetase alpha chain